MQTSLQWDFILDTIQFGTFETPQEFEIGFEKNLVVHRYLSENGQSNIVTHTLGIYPVPTKWTGTFYYANALTRYQALESLAVSDGPINWTYGPLNYTVVVKSVVGKIRHQLEIDYEIEIVVISANNAIVPGSLPQSADVEATTFYSDGTDAWDNFNSTTYTALPKSVIAAYNTMIASISVTAPFSTASIASLQVCYNSIGAFNTTLGATLTTMQSQALDENGTNQLIAGLQVQANFTQFQNYIGTLTGANSNTNISVSAQSGTSLFTLSSQFYPNLSPDQGAAMIAQANNMNDFFVSAQANLVIPPLSLSIGI